MSIYASKKIAEQDSAPTSLCLSVGAESCSAIQVPMYTGTQLN